MRRRLTKIGNSWGLILPRDLLDLLGVEREVEVEAVGSTLVITAPDVDPVELQAALAYLTSRRERAEVYRRLAE